MTLSDINTHGYMMTNGRHAGEPITRVPVGYLKWMVNANHKEATYARAELDRRGTTTPTIEASGHAIDRASQQCLDIWKSDTGQKQGLHSWLVMIAAEALQNGTRLESGKIRYRGMKFAFEEGSEWPVLKTVMRSR